MAVNETRIENIEDELKEQRKTVTEQGQVMAVLVSTIQEIKQYTKEAVEIQRENAVLFEKFTNHEERNNDEHQHLHNRLDKLETRCDRIELNHKSTCEVVQPMAEKGASVHKALVRTAWGLGAMVGVMLFWLVIWGIKTSNYRP